MPSWKDAHLQAIDEAPLVMPKANIIDSILEGLKREIEKKFKRNNA